MVLVLRLKGGGASSICGDSAGGGGDHGGGSGQGDGGHGHGGGDAGVFCCCWCFLLVVVAAAAPAPAPAELLPLPRVVAGRRGSHSRHTVHRVSAALISSFPALGCPWLHCPPVLTVLEQRRFDEAEAVLTSLVGLAVGETPPFCCAPRAPFQQAFQWRWRGDASEMTVSPTACRSAVQSTACRTPARPSKALPGKTPRAF